MLILRILSEENRISPASMGLGAIAAGYAITKGKKGVDGRCVRIGFFLESIDISK